MQRTTAALLALTVLCAAGPLRADDTGRNLAAACASCHGPEGVSRGGIPSLAGKNAAELIRAMQEFRDGRRPSTVMQQLARGYSDEDVSLIAAWLAARKPEHP